ncbi:MAG: NifU family protein [Planctomycetota bacterium]
MTPPAPESAASATSDPLTQRVLEAIDRVRPAIVADGGDVELVDVSPEGVAKVRLMGACVNCPSSQMTLKDGLERSVRASVPEITTVLAVT